MTEWQEHKLIDFETTVKKKTFQSYLLSSTGGRNMCGVYQQENFKITVNLGQLYEGLCVCVEYILFVFICLGVDC